MRISDLNEPALAYVARHMRAADRDEIFATRWSDDPASVVAAVLSGGTFAWVAGLERPIAAIGAMPMWEGVWSVWMFATDDFRQIRFGLTRFVVRSMIPALRASGAHRAECRSIATHTEAHRWLELLGAEREATLRGYGRRGEDFELYVWRR